MKKDKQLEQLNNEKGFFSWLPEEIALSDNFNHTEKYVFAALLSLSNIRGGLKNGIRLRTKALANKIGISTRVLQYTIKSLSSKNAHLNDVYSGPLISVQKTNKKAYKQIIIMNYYDEDAYILIPTDIINSNLSIPSKLFYGRAFAARPGFTYDTINDIADYTEYSDSSAYRHINILIKSGFINRDASDLTVHRYVTNDNHSNKRYNKSKRDKANARAKRIIESNRKNNAPPIKAPKKPNPMLDEIWNQIGKGAKQLKTRTA